MEGDNRTRNPVFLLMGFSEKPEIQSLLFGLFLSLYLVTLLGNLLIILAILSDPRLHTPMYLFLSNLSFSDICFTSTTVPKMLLDIQTQSKAITHAGCITQMYFFTVFGLLDNLLLTVMAYDRFVAVCHPLHYVAVMSPTCCAQLLLLAWLISLLGALPESLTALQLSFCTVVKIPHYFCELPELLQLACSGAFINNVVLYVVTGVMGFFPLAGILVSYSQVVASVLRSSTAGAKYKAFSTCGSHLSFVSLFYGTCLGVYLSSTWTQNSWAGMFASVLYTVVTPMMNPFIYSLRNTEMKTALRTLLCGLLSTP
ncbi:olfactory receptor 7C1-like [Ctenodactylus gundi]